MQARLTCPKKPVGKTENMMRIFKIQILCALLIFIPAHSIANNRICLDVKIRSVKGLINISIKNNCNQKYIIPTSILLSGNIFFFENSPEINFNGIIPEKEIPQMFDQKYIEMEKNCNLDNDNNYKVLYPKETTLFLYDIRLKYNIEKNRKYKIFYLFEISKKYKNFCPLIWTGIMKSNRIVYSAK